MNNKGTDQSVRMHRLISTFFCIQLKRFSSDKANDIVFISSHIVGELIVSMALLFNHLPPVNKIRANSTLYDRVPVILLT